LYATGEESYVIQGWVVTDPAILEKVTIAADETVVEVPPALLQHLASDGLDGVVMNLIAPIVGVTPKGNYIVQGKRVTDSEVLSQMRIPENETCVHVTKVAVAALVGR
jgi:hypothetical protein